MFFRKHLEKSAKKKKKLHHILRESNCLLDPKKKKLFFGLFMDTFINIIIAWKSPNF